MVIEEEELALQTELVCELKEKSQVEVRKWKFPKVSWRVTDFEKTLVSTLKDNSIGQELSG